jgi:hypothetical protein
MSSEAPQQPTIEPIPTKASEIIGTAIEFYTDRKDFAHLNLSYEQGALDEYERDAWSYAGMNVHQARRDGRPDDELAEIESDCYAHGLYGEDDSEYSKMVKSVEGLTKSTEESKQTIDLLTKLATTLGDLELVTVADVEQIMVDKDGDSVEIKAINVVTRDMFHSNEPGNYAHVADLGTLVAHLRQQS